MKKITLILLILLSNITYAQEKKKNNMPNSTNFLDMQIEVFKDITKDSVIDGIDFSKITNYKDLIGQAKDLTQKEKTYYKSLYELQAKEPNQKTKDSIGKVLSALIMKTKKK